MSIIDSLVTDRTAADVSRIEQLNKKGLAGMTAEELSYFLHGSPAPLIAKDGPLEASDGQLDIYDNIVKGDYRAADLNRVYSAMAYVAERLQSQGYVVNLPDGTDFDANGWTDTNDLSLYLQILKELRGKLSMMSDTPEVPADMEGLTWQEANDIERILEDIARLLTNTEQAWFYSGDLFSGEV